MTVVRDDAQSLVAWLPPGTVVLKAVLDTGEDVRAAPLPERYRRKFSMAKTLWRGEGSCASRPSLRRMGVSRLMYQPANTRKADLAEKAVESWQSPFCDGWEDWRPDPGWITPALPQGASWDLDLTPTHHSQPSDVHETH